MVVYKCPSCGHTLTIGIEISMGGPPHHICPKCKTELVKVG